VAGRIHQRRRVEAQRIAKELNLTPEQEEGLKQNRITQNEQMKELRTALKEQMTKLKEELNKPEVNQAALKTIATELKSLHAQMVDQRLASILAVKKILTSEQFAKFQRMTMEKAEKRRERLERKLKRKGEDKEIEEGNF
jgi:Spy/CpxP family protein refolding chaperone